MSTLAIEINDAGLVVADESGVLAAEPGFAYVDSSGIVTGRRAAEQARLKPDRVASRYWAELGTEEPSGFRAVGASPAELAYAQLESLWRPFAERVDAAVLVVPGSYTKDQLGLLLGLADECRIPVRAMIDTAVAASTRPYPDRQLVYADAGLHRVSVTPLEQSTDVRAGAERGLEAGGLSTYREMIAKRAAELFVGATRFDPFHDAPTEQKLYDRLTDWLAALHTQESIELSLPYGGDDIVVDVRREQLLGAAGGFYKALVQLIAASRAAGEPLVVQLSDRLAQLPGLERELARLDAASVVRLPEGFAARASLKLVEDLPAGGEVKWIRRAAWREAAVPLDAAPPPANPAALEREPAGAVQAPTHVVYRGVAYPVGAGGLLIGRSRSNGAQTIVVDDQSGVSRSHCRLHISDGEMRLEDLSSYGTYVNERRVSGEEPLKPADVIRIGSPGAQLQVVSVESGHGA